VTTQISNSAEVRVVPAAHTVDCSDSSGDLLEVEDSAMAEASRRDVPVALFALLTSTEVCGAERISGRSGNQTIRQASVYSTVSTGIGCSALSTGIGCSKLSTGIGCSTRGFQ